MANPVRIFESLEVVHNLMKGLDQYGAERVLPGNGPRHARNEGSTATVGQPTRWGEVAQTFGYGPTCLHHHNYQGNLPMGSSNPPWCPPPLNGW